MQLPALTSLGIVIKIGRPGRQGINVEIRKCEHREHCERGLEQKQLEIKVLHSSSVAFENSEVF